MNMIDYWYEVDLKGGAGVSEMYVEDGIFHGGPGKPLVGRAAIEQFYTWRQDRGARTSRHVITNFRAEFTDDIARDHVLRDDAATRRTASRYCRRRPRS